MEGLENMAFIANAVSLITYFTGYMNFGLAKSANSLTNFMGTSFLLALFGGFISDTYLSRFMTCVVFGCIELLVSASDGKFLMPLLSMMLCAIHITPMHFVLQKL